jgi:hypothetical protein
MSVNGVQFAVPSGTTVGVRVPVHAVPLQAEQRTIVPTLMRSTPHNVDNNNNNNNNNSGTTVVHQHQQAPGAADPHASFSPTSRRETVANAAANPAVQLSANLLRSVRAGNLAESRELLAQGASASLLHGAVSAFHVAALQSDPAVMELLLQSPGVNTELKNRNGETALHYASYHRNAPIQRTLLHAGANVHARTTGGDSALHLAASVGAVGDVIEQLVTVMSQCPLHSRSVCCQRVALTIGLHDSFGRSVLARAVVNGTTRTVEQLLALMPQRCACACGMCATGECVTVARATWRQTLLASRLVCARVRRQSPAERGAARRRRRRRVRGSDQGVVAQRVRDAVARCGACVAGTVSDDVDARAVGLLVACSSTPTRFTSSFWSAPRIDTNIQQHQQ